MNETDRMPPHVTDWTLWKIVVRKATTRGMQNWWGCQAVTQLQPTDVVIGECWYPSDLMGATVLYAWFEAYPPAFRHVLHGELKAADVFATSRAEAEYLCWAGFGSESALRDHIATLFMRK